MALSDDRIPLEDCAMAVLTDEKSRTDLLNRLKRAEGQLRGIQRMIEEGEQCRDIVTQLAAVSKALDRAGFAVIAAGLRQCITESGPEGGVDTASLEKLFLSLA